MTQAERELLDFKIREVEEAIEDLRACFDPSANITLEQCRERSRAARLHITELKVFCKESLS